MTRQAAPAPSEAPSGAKVGRDRHVRTYLATGRTVEIGEPVDIVDVRREVAEPLARIARYHGHCADADGNPLSVAEHCVHGADALRAELVAGGTARSVATATAYAFLIHDDHEAITNDPPRDFVARLAQKFSGVASHRTLIHDAIEECKQDVSADLGLGLPDTRPLALPVEAMDRRMAAAEIAFAFGGAAARNRLAEPPIDVGLVAPLPDIGGTGVPGFPADWKFWTWQRASAEWISRFIRWRKELGVLSDPALERAMQAVGRVNPGPRIESGDDPGGPDNKMIVAGVHPGERIDFTPAGGRGDADPPYDGKGGR